MTILRNLRPIFENLLARRGWGLRALDEAPRGFVRMLDLYRRLAPSPATVIDVGVGHGTPWLHGGFPDARLVLVEPLDIFADGIRTMLKDRDGVWHHCALAETPGELEMHVSPTQPTGSSLLARDPDLAARYLQRGDAAVLRQKVAVCRLDDIAAGERGPIALKIDVEGAELGVLRGGEATLAKTELIVLEASVTRRHVGEADFVSIAHHLREKGFALADIVEMSTFGQNRALGYVDAAFARPDGAFLQKLWRS